MRTQTHKKLQPPRLSKRTLHNRHRDVTKALKGNRIDIDALHSALLSFTLLSGKLRSARTKRPVNKWTRGDFGQFLNELDRDLRVAVAMLAGELGFSVCRCCWPQEVLATDLKGQITPLAGTDIPREMDEPVFVRKIKAKRRGLQVTPS